MVRPSSAPVTVNTSCNNSQPQPIIPNSLHSTSQSTTQSITGTATSLQQPNNNNNANSSSLNRPLVNNGHRGNSLLNNNQDLYVKSGRDYYNGETTNNLSRLAPEGKDAEHVGDEIRNNNKTSEASGVLQPAEVYSTSSNENGKINVQVTVLFGKLKTFAAEIINFSIVMIKVFSF